MNKGIGIGARVSHPKYGEGIIYNINETTFSIFFKEEDKEISKSFEGLEVLEAAAVPDTSISLEDIEVALRNVLKEENAIEEIVELGDKWKKGIMILKPYDPSLQPKEIPIDTFFHKIVMLRDRLRVLEQNINSSSSLNDEEKVHLQQYITRGYGSLTTFNVLFKYQAQQFKGAGK